MVNPPDHDERGAQSERSPKSSQRRRPGAQLKWHKRLSGTKIGRYRLGARLGVGGAASVYMGRLAGPHQFERVVAIKLIHEHLLEEPEFVSMFLDEAKLVSRLSHPNIVHVYELGRDRDLLFTAMEYLVGQPLSQVNSSLLERGRRLPYDVLAWIGARAADGLHHAHELCDEEGRRVGLVHRDMSPDNLFVTYDGYVKVIDFGIARAVGRLTTTALGTLKGKYRYMAPEQALGKDFDHRVDLFALGATLYESVLGRPVFLGADDSDTLLNVLSGPAPDPRRTVDGFPDGLAEIIVRALAMVPEERYQTASELARDLDSFAVASGGRDQRETLSGIMQGLFVAQREAAQRAISELRAIDESEAQEADHLPTSIASRQRRGWRLPLFWGIPLLGAMILAARWMNAPVLPAPSPATSSVTLEIRTEPPVDATVTVGQDVLRGRTVKRTVLRSNVPVTVVVAADGYREARLTLVQDRDQAVVIPLVALPPPGADPALAPPSAEAAISGGDVTSVASDVAFAAGGAPPVPPAARPKRYRPALVTEYPYR